MIWHIFKKDCRLLWKYVLAVAAIHFGFAAILYKLGIFWEYPVLASLVELIQVVAFLGLALIIVTGVYQDPVPGERQDWLVRPIRRLDLLLAKLLFVVLMAQGPILLADLIEPLANGFSLRESIVAALGRAAFILFAFTIPLFAVASITRNFTEGVVSGVVIFLWCGGLLLLISGLLGSHRPTENMPTVNTGVVWIMELARSGIVVLVGGAILCLQYFRRRTLASRVLTGIGGFIWVVMWFFPWGPAFAIEKRLSPRAGSGDTIGIAFAPSDGRYRIPPGRGPAQPSSDVVAYLPVRITGLSTDSISVYDHVETVLIDAQGNRHKLTAFDFVSHREGPDDSISAGHNGFHIPRDLYNRVKDQPVQLEVEYSLTLFSLSRSYAIPAVNGEERMPELGFCKTKVDEDGDEVELGCMNPGTQPSCITAFLENTATGKRNPPRSPCLPDYIPYPGKILHDDIYRFGTRLPFRDLTGLAKFPVDGTQLNESRVVVRLFEPQDHFTRRLVFSNIVLKDWEEQ
jgi:hypothetical protein